MANDFDQFPTYDPITKANTDLMSDVWTDFISTFYQNLIGYLTQYGVLLPRVTVAQRNSIQAPKEGQMIYTVDSIPGPPRTAAVQIWQVKSGVGAWYTFTTT